MCCSGTQWSMSNCETTVKTNCWEQSRVQHIHYQAAIILSITVPSIKLISWEMPPYHWRFCFSAMQHMAKLKIKMAKMIWIWRMAKYGQPIQTYQQTEEAPVSGMKQDCGCVVEDDGCPVRPRLTWRTHQSLVIYSRLLAAGPSIGSTTVFHNHGEGP